MSGCQEEAAAIQYGYDLALKDIRDRILGDICECCDVPDPECNCNVRFIKDFIKEGLNR